ncbi:NAD(P)/FAD-dependent oxidoreductase [Streptomyces sp. ME19-01-6]|uniref:NAD(P)/FAD-dependent oxidoreductase n=1 Tax=Streptomyces sp. ME19-01-6 TaxID=3028686 RepID=UPI0029B68968|nr:FAD-dependent oxidoreductase [Streptomyces sp. ME19-01-6]MDX3224440.1 FAD-dependent oxidoreductase [Streptomyces sp. ME19-01-6]
MRSNREPGSGRRVVIVGGGMAGTRLAQQLAAMSAESAEGADSAVEVTVIGEEPHLAYNRVLLAEVLAGRYTPDVIALPAPAAVRRISGVRVVRLDRDPGEVVCDDGRRVPYDSLVLATGSNPVLPPLRGLFEPHGHDLPDGVHAFRTMDDCLALAAAVRPGVRAVVIGGGLLGVSAARALAQRGAQVVLAHQGEHLMERQLDTGAAQMLRSHVEALGVEVHTECRVRGLRTRTSNGGKADGGGRAVSAVELADGYALDADLVILACGARPRVGLAHAAGLDVARGVVVDDQLRTSDPRIFAIGDCAEHDGVLYGLAGPAQDQADTLAHVVGNRAAEGAPPSGSWGKNRWAQPGHRAAHGGDTRPRYSGSRTLTRLTLASASAANPLDLASFGETTPAPGDDVVHLTDATRNAYRKVVVRGDRLVGGILLGDLGSVGALARTWEGDEPLPSAPLLHLLTNDGGS